ncbi:MAG: alanine dehydrogenase [bacterium]|nr:alanine dehydrogenase [bacterium]
MKYKTLILERRSIENIINMKDVIKAMEYAYREYGMNRCKMPPKLYLNLDKHKGDFRAMPGYIERLNKCALKWVNVHPENTAKGLPTVMAVIILSDPSNGFPLCIMDGTLATNLRTGAAGGLAAKYLARKNSNIIGLVGCGVQAKTQLMALNELFNIKEVMVWGNKQSFINNFIKNKKKIGLKFTAAKNVKECVRNSDIVITTTPSRKPLVKLEWLKKGVHINAIGADAKGKEELDPLILKNAKVIVDSWEQASHSGEINLPVSKGIISKKDIYADIGEIVTGRKKARTNENEITVFDSTGLAIQDVAIANLIYKTALKKKLGMWVNLI